MSTRTIVERKPTEIAQFINELVRVKHRAGELGLFATMQAIDNATQEVGWEVAASHDPKQLGIRERYLKSRNQARVRR